MIKVPDYNIRYAFDEIDGLRWEEKNKQIEHSCIKILKQTEENLHFTFTIRLLFSS